MLYIDESIQHDLGYICVAIVYSENDPDANVKDCLALSGFNAETDEYNSGTKMTGDRRRHALREQMLSVLTREANIGVLIAPTAKRSLLGALAVDACAQIIAVNQLPAPQNVFLDEGMPLTGCVIDLSVMRVHSNCDSRTTRGIQLADCAAYHCSYMLKSRLTGVYKKVPMKWPIGFSDEAMVDLEWIVRHDLRRSFFMESKPWDDSAGDLNFLCKMSGYGSFIDPDLPNHIAEAAAETFDEVWMGCIY